MEHGTAWEKFWGELPDDEYFPWGGLPGDTWFPRAAGYIPDGRPVLDVPCGDGHVTRWLAEKLAARIPQVVGADVAAAAVRRAAETPATGAPILWRQLNLLDEQQVRQMASELGPATVFTRFLLHLLPPEDQARAAAHLSQLAGNGGRVINFEVTHPSPGTIDGFLDRFPTLQRSLFSGDVMTDVGQLAPGDLRGLHEGAGMEVLASDSDSWTVPGTTVILKCDWVVAGNPPS